MKTRHVVHAVCIAALLLNSQSIWSAPQPVAAPTSGSLGRITIEAAAVPLNPSTPSMTAIGDFTYAGGLVLTSPNTNLLHELSDIIITGPGRFAAVGDGGVMLEASFVLDDSDRLVGVKDATLTRLIGENGRPLEGNLADAEGLTLLPSGDRLVSFERRHRIWLYPANGGLPRPVTSPNASFPSNAGMEGLAAEPDVADDAYLVGGEDSGETWTCRISNGCVHDRKIEKPKEFGLVSINRVSPGVIAYMLRAYDPVRHNRITLEIFRGAAVVARMDMAPPLTVDNFEGMTSTAGPNGARRFYLLSDDNNRPSQRTLLMAFDWQAK